MARNITRLRQHASAVTMPSAAGFTGLVFSRGNWKVTAACLAVEFPLGWCASLIPVDPVLSHMLVWHVLISTASPTRVAEVRLPALHRHAADCHHRCQHDSLRIRLTARHCLRSGRDPVICICLQTPWSLGETSVNGTMCRCFECRYFFSSNVLAAYPFMVARAAAPMPGLTGVQSNTVIMMGAISLSVTIFIIEHVAGSLCRTCPMLGSKCCVQTGRSCVLTWCSDIDAKPSSM